MISDGSGAVIALSPRMMAMMVTPVEHRLDLLHHRRLEEGPAQNRAELARLVVAQLHRRGLVGIGGAAIDHAAPAVMDDDGDATAVDSRHLVAATDSWQILDDEVETAVGLHALALLCNGIDQA
jgi:hypothetical protein